MDEVTGAFTHSDLRVLVCERVLEHSLETTRPEDAGRRFRETTCLRFTSNSCFVFPARGPAWLEEYLAADPRGEEPQTLLGPARSRADSTRLPFWDDEARDLYWAGTVIKHFRNLAPFQTTVLRTFQARKWPRSIAISLPKPEQGNVKLRLQNAVKRLAHNLTPHLWFGVEASGTHVVWRAWDDPNVIQR